jgi:hypothetical protein
MGFKEAFRNTGLGKLFSGRGNGEESEAEIDGYEQDQKTKMIEWAIKKKNEDRIKKLITADNIDEARSIAVELDGEATGDEPNDNLEWLNGQLTSPTK